MIGNWGILLAIAGLAAVAMGALKKFEFETEGEFELGDYETELGFDFEVDKKGKKRNKKRKGRDRPNPKDQPNQIDTDKPMLVPENIDMFPYYNRDILW